MNNKNLLTDKLGEIDSKFLDEYHDRRSRRAIRRKSVMKYCSIAASVMLVIIISLATMSPMFRNTPTGNPVDTSNGIIDNEDSNKDNTTSDTKLDHSTYTVIYAEDNQGTDNSMSDVFENVYVSPNPGEIRYSGEVYNIMNDEDDYENCLFAVRMTFSMEFEKSAEYEKLLKEREAFWELIWERYDDEIVTHFKSHALAHGGMDITCDECLRLNSLHEKDLSDYNAMGEQLLSIAEADKAAYDEKVCKKADSFIANTGFEYKNVTIVWTDNPDETENVPTDSVMIFHLTKEQLGEITPSIDLGIDIKLVPEWMDTGEDTVFNGGWDASLE